PWLAAADFRVRSYPDRHQPLARDGLDHAAVRRVRRPGRPRDPDGISDDGIVGPWIPARRRPDIARDRVAGLRMAAGGQDSQQRVADFGWRKNVVAGGRQNQITFQTNVPARAAIGGLPP